MKKLVNFALLVFMGSFAGALAQADTYDESRIVISAYNYPKLKECWMLNQAFSSALSSKLGKSNFSLEVFPHNGMKDQAYPDNEVGIRLVNLKDRDSSVRLSTRISGGNHVSFGFDATESFANEKGGFVAVRYWMPNLDQAVEECKKDFFESF